MSILRFRRTKDRPPQQPMLPQGQKLKIYLNGDLFAEHEVIFQNLPDGRVAWGLLVSGQRNMITGDGASLSMLYGIETKYGRVPE